MNGIRRASLASGLVLLLASLWLLAAAPAAAWEWVYGPLNTLDEGHRRVTPAVVCPGGGYIAVGTHAVGTANPDVYVVRTNNSGGLFWELSYDVQGGVTVDEGIALAEVPGAVPAIVILSNTLVGGFWQPALTQLDCNGAFMWSRTYPSRQQHLRGHDLVRTATPGAGGDLAVAGLAFNGVNDDAFLLRTTAAGSSDLERRLQHRRRRRRPGDLQRVDRGAAAGGPGGRRPGGGRALHRPQQQRAGPGGAGQRGHRRGRRRAAVHGASRRRRRRHLLFGRPSCWCRPSPASSPSPASPPTGPG